MIFMKGTLVPEDDRRVSRGTKLALINWNLAKSCGGVTVHTLDISLVIL